MFSRWIPVAVVALAPFVALGGPHEDYIAALGKYKIEGLSAPEELKELKADAYLELKAKVTGSIKRQDGTITILAVFGPFSQTIETAKAPDWLVMGVSDVRLIVKATLVPTQLVPALELVASLPEADMVVVEAKIQADAAKKAEEEFKKAEAARMNLQMKTQSRGGLDDFSRTPPPGVTGIIGGGGSASTDQLTALVPEYASYILGRNKSLPANQAQLIAECVLAYSSVYGVDARLVMAIITHESNFNPTVTSHAGAQGLGQLMPDTARGLGITNSFDIVQNVYGTVRTIRGHLERQAKSSKDNYDQLVRALAAYNAGPGAVKRYNGLPPYAETEAYVEKVIRTYFQLSGHRP